MVLDLGFGKCRLVVAAKEAEGIPEGSALAAFKALSAADVATAGKESLQAWVEGSSEPAGRAAALEQTKAWIAGL